MTDAPELRIEGKAYRGWTEISVGRALDQGCAEFTLSSAERWPGLDQPWRILPFSSVEIRLGDDLVLTGYVDRLAPVLAPGTADVRVQGRSKTADLVDCTPELAGTEFRRATLPAIARALAKPFGVEVIERADCGGPIALERIDRADTAWDTIERLCRMRAVLATDDPLGRLVLVRAGTARASTALVQGQNVLEASADLNVSKRYSRYIVLGQSGSAAAQDIAGDGDADDDEPAERAGAGAVTAVEGIAADPDVPRYRPRVLRADSNGTAADARARAVWAATTGRARALRAEAIVAGWRQADGRLWQVNELVQVTIPRLDLDRDMLVVAVDHSLTVRGGRRTRLTLIPPEALAPEPVAAPTGRGSWADVKPIA